MELSGYYRLFSPRQTALVSTADKDGKVNVAPFSFCMPVSMSPPLLAFAAVSKRHTLANIKETEEFVINLPQADAASKVFECGTSYPKGVDESEKAGLTKEKSGIVKAPRIKESVAWFECKLHSLHEVGDHIIVVGEVVNMGSGGTENGRLEFKNGPLMHVSGKEFCVPGEIVQV